MVLTSFKSDKLANIRFVEYPEKENNITFMDYPFDEIIPKVVHI